MSAEGRPRTGEAKLAEARLGWVQESRGQEVARYQGAEPCATCTSRLVCTGGQVAEVAEGSDG
jgi:hypothetical protein